MIARSLGWRTRWLMTALLLAAGVARAQPVEITDDRDVRVMLPAPPKRIVSLLPSITETVCALGGCARLVGVDRHSNYPAEVRALPRAGEMEDAQLETIMALRPDVVLLGFSSRASGRLEALGLKVIALNPRTHEDVKRLSDRLARLLSGTGAEQASAKLWQGIQAQIDAAAQSLPPPARGVRVYYEVHGGNHGASESSFIGQTLARLGAVNIVPASLGPFPKLNPEYVVRASPDVIMVSTRSLVEIDTRPGWSGLEAVRRQRICRFTFEESDLMLRPGPRMGEAAQLMARCLRNAMSSPANPS